MNAPSLLWQFPALHRATQASALLAIAIGSLVLLGWILGIDLLLTALPGLDAMRPTTAFGLILAGVALLLVLEPTTRRYHRLGQAASLGVLAIGLTTMLNLISNWRLQINPLFFTHYVDFIPAVPNGHMSPLTGFCFLCLGSALGVSSTYYQWRNDQERWVEILALGSSLVAVQVLVSYLYGVKPIIQFTAYQQMPLHAAIAFLALAAGILLAHPSRGFVGIVLSNSVGGAVARRLLPAAILVPLLLGGFRIVTARLGLFDPDFGTALLAVLHILILTSIVAWNAQQIHYIDLQRRAAESALAHMNADLESRVIERTAQLQAANTERKQTEEEQQQLATIIENSPDFIATADLNGQLRYLNPAGRALVGLDSSAPIRHLNGKDLHPPARSSFLETQLTSTLLDQGVWQGETLLRHFQTGKLIPVYQTTFINRDRTTGQPLNIATVMRDLRDRKQAEADLRQSEQRFRAAVLESPLPIMLHAEDGEVIEVNRAWVELSGYAPEDIPTIADWTEKAYGSRQELVQADIEHLHRLDHRISEGEYIVTARTGETRTWDFYSAPLSTLPDGRSLVLSTAIDVTERNRAEAELQQTLKDLADFKFALDQSSIVAITNAQGTITYVNDKFCELSQYSREELIGQNHRLINSGYHSQAFFRQMWQTIAAGEVWQGEIRNRARDGSFYWVATTIVPFLDQQGKPYQYIAVRSDITNRKATEAELLQLNVTLEQRVEERTAQLQESNRNLEAFSYTIAHDLRAPLRSIQGFTKALLEDFGSDLNQAAQEYIQSVLEGAQRMNQLIDDLLTYSRLSSERIHPTKVSLAQVIAAAQDQLAADLKQQQAVVEIAPTLPTVMGQRTLLVQMITNLLSNAIKFVAPGRRPQVKIWAERLPNPVAGECSDTTIEALTEPRVRLWVEDNGIGIEPEYQQQIFGVFERLHGRDAYPGTGIGLAIVRKGAERQGGCVGVESAPGQGSRFWIELRGAE